MCLSGRRVGSRFMPDLNLLLQQAHTEYRRRHPQSEALARAAAEWLPAGNTRSVLDFEPFPFRVVEVDGPYLVDADGHRYLDLLGNYSAGLLGHRPQIVEEAVTSVLADGWSLGAISPREAELASRLTSRFPSIDKVRFTNSGTEANLMAIATARHGTGRRSVVVFNGGYHGGLLYFGEGGDPMLVPHDWIRLEYNDAEGLEQAFEARGGEIAAVLVEPMMAASGCIPAAPGFLPKARELCARHGGVLIFDEVMTSRFSTGGAQKLLDVVPDMTTLGKYLAGGLTFGAFGGRSELMSAFDRYSGGQLAHGGTFNNNELTIAAASSVLAAALSEEILRELNQRGDRLREGLNDRFRRAQIPMSATGQGSLMTIHGTANPVTSPRDLASSDTRWKDLLFFHLLLRGFYMARRGFIALSIDVTDGHVEQFLAEVEDWAVGVGMAPTGG